MGGDNITVLPQWIKEPTEARLEKKPICAYADSRCEGRQVCNRCIHKTDIYYLFEVYASGGTNDRLVYAGTNRADAEEVLQRIMEGDNEHGKDNKD